MKFNRTAPIGALLALALVAPARAAAVGSHFPAAKLDGFAQTKAKSLDDFVGRAVLVEFFAFW